jgi:hypothetical protein
MPLMMDEVRGAVQGRLCQPQKRLDIARRSSDRTLRCCDEEHARAWAAPSWL